MSLPSQQQILLPLLQHLQDHGPTKAADAAEALAETMALSAEDREARVPNHGGKVWDRRVRWVRQTAVLDGLIRSAGWGVWDLAEKGHKSLTEARPGVCVCVVMTDLGRVLWSEAMTAMGYIEDESVQLILTSPPYPLNRQRDYPAWSTDNYLDSLVSHFDRAKRLLTADGSLVVNLCDCYEAGAPELQTYQEELVVLLKQRGWRFCGRQVWFNPGKPKTTDWVTKKRVRMANGLETLFWWSPTANPYADNRQILEPYTDRYVKTLAEGGIHYREQSGSRQSHPGLRYRVDNGGKIPFNLLQCGTEGPKSAYMRHCRANGLPCHPARMPPALAEQWIKFTTREGDTVFDMFGGSLVVPAAAEHLGRHHISSEMVLEYIRGGAFRLGEARDLRVSPPSVQEPAAHVA